MERRVLVTGGTGYIGTALVPVLAKAYPVRVFCSMHFGNAIASTPHVEFIKGDITDYEALKRAMVGVTDIVHLAAIVTDELVDMNPTYAAKINEDGTRTLCQIAVEAGVKRLIYASSSSVYGTQDAVCSEETLPKPSTKYGGMKLEGEAIINDYAAPHMVISHVRSATCCGPAPRMRLDTIVNVFSAQAYFKRNITVFGGDQWRSNIHVADVADLYAWLLEQPPEHIHKRAFNAVTSYDTALDLAVLVQSLVGGRVSVDISKRDPRHYRMVSTALPALGWIPARTLERAVLDNVFWFQKGYIQNMDDSIWYNTRRMEALVKGV